MASELRTTRQWLNHVLPTLLVLSGEQHHTQLLNDGVSSYAGYLVTSNLHLRPFFSCCPGFLFQNDLRTLSAVEHSFFVAVDFSREHYYSGN